MQPYTFVPWAWRDPSAMTTVNEGLAEPAPDALPTDSAEADQRAAADVSGYGVEATDGSIGSIDEATYEVGGAHLVVDTGPWIFGRKVMLPAGTVERVDWDDMSVYVDRTKDQIKDSPELGEDDLTNPSYRDRVGTYYGDTYDERNPL
jgi:hypothetical protein